MARDRGIARVIADLGEECAVPVRAIRGATRLSADDPDEMTDAVVELVEAMLALMSR